VLLDRQEHAWPTATKAADTKIPTVVFAPLGAAFTTNTAPLAQRPGVFVSSALDFTEARYGLKMLKAGAKLRETRCLVIKGGQRLDSEVRHFGTKLRYLPASSFLEEYNRTPLTGEIKSMAAAYLRAARRVTGATKEDLCNGIKSYVVARNILEREARCSTTASPPLVKPTSAPRSRTRWCNCSSTVPASSKTPWPRPPANA
jgi:hypothetical protein